MTWERAAMMILVAISVFLIFIIFWQQSVGNRMGGIYISRRIVFFGPPGSGKTTLAALMMEAVSHSSRSGTTQLRGAKCILTKDAYVRALRAGRFPEKTTVFETDVFRFDHKRTYQSQLFPFLSSGRKYRFEIADFAGEYTDWYGKQAIETEHGDGAQKKSLVEIDNEFERWIAEADACVFFLDGERVAEQASSYIPEMITYYTTMWSMYLDQNVRRVEGEFAIPVYIVVTKFDLLLEKVHGRPVDTEQSVEHNNTIKKNRELFIHFLNRQNVVEQFNEFTKRLVSAKRNGKQEPDSIIIPVSAGYYSSPPEEGEHGKPFKLDPRGIDPFLDNVIEILT